MNYKSMLFMPGNNPGMLFSSSVLGADAIIIDLEDAVSSMEKDAARILVREYLESFDNPDSDVVVRINPTDSPYFYEDLKMLRDAKFDCIMLPKASVESVTQLDEYLKEEDWDIDVFALIETAMGIEDSLNILSASDKIIGVLLGAEDLSLDLGAERTKQSEEIRYARQKIVAVSKALEIQAIDTPFTDTDDLEGLKVDTEFAKAMGMTGKAAISPRHVNTLNTIFAPTEEEINYAVRVAESGIDAKAKGLGAWSLDGEMIDAPVIKRAITLLRGTEYFKEEYDELV